MAKRLFALSCIFVLLFTATGWANEGLVSFKVVESPLEVKVSVVKSKFSYKIQGSALNKGSEDLYNSQAKLTIKNEQGVKLNFYSKKLGVIKASQTKNLSWKTNIRQPSTYIAELIVSGFNKSKNTEHIMGAETTFGIQASSSLLSLFLKHLYFWGRFS